MKFQVSRTSLSLDNESKPCNEALQVKAIYLDVRTKPLEWFKSQPEDRKFKEFLSKGKNHRNITVDGEPGCVRELDPHWIWVVKIESLKMLLQFQEKYGEIILQKSNYKEVPLEIEIYDYYRE